MNEGLLALIIIVATIGAAIWAAMYRDLIWPTSPSGPSRPAGRVVSRPGRMTPAPRRSPALAETPAKPAAIISEPISAVTTPKNDAETIAIMTIAKLIAAGQVGETAALQTVFAVKPGSSRRYKEVQRKLKIAQEELTAIEPAGSIEPAGQR